MSPENKELHPWLEEDFSLTQVELDSKYNEDGDGEHPFFTRWDWIQVVAQRSTYSGYWEWLQYKIDELYWNLLRKEKA